MSARDYKDAGTDGMNKNSAKMIPVTKAWPAEITSSLCASDGPKGVSDQYAHEGKLIAMAHGQGGAEIGIDRCPTLTCVHEAPIAAYFPIQPIALAENTIGRQPENGGNGDGFTDGGPMYTLNATGVHGVAQPIAFAFDSLSSNSMKSKNPISGCNQADISKSLDTSRGLDPSCNQGGMAIAQPIAYNIAPGKGILKDDIHVTNADSTKTLDAFGSNPAMHQGGAAILQPISFDMAQITSKVNGTRVEPGLPVSTLAKGSQMHVAQSIFFEPRSPDGVPRIYPMDGAAPTLNTMGGGQREPCVTHAVGTDLYNGAITGEVAATMTKSMSGTGTGPTAMQAMAVRRLTPVECERLQGFPDNYTDIMPKNKATPDGPRYKALGNSMAVPVMAWIGKRIQENELLNDK